jgi:hypothetical protein
MVWATNARAVRSALLALAMSGALTAGASAAPGLKSLHSFCRAPSCADGQGPGNLAADAQGNLYGATFAGGRHRQNRIGGTVFELVNGGTFRTIYKFCRLRGCADGAEPAAPLVVDTQGNLYGVTTRGAKRNSGVAYELSPNADHTAWTYSLLYKFCSKGRPICSDGANPGRNAGLTYAGAASGALYDGVSPLYGTAGHTDPNDNNGVVYRLTPSAPGSLWSEKVLHFFCSPCTDGSIPESSLLVDGSGNLFGTTAFGGKGQGIAYELSPTGRRRWHETILYNFCSSADCTDGAYPQSALIADAQGNLYGTTQDGGSPCLISNIGSLRCGVIFKLAQTGGSWSQSVLHTFCETTDCPDGGLPEGGLLMDASGNLFGTASSGGGHDVAYNDDTGGGTVFELSGSHFRVLYAFCVLDSCLDGDGPETTLVMPSPGTLVGTTAIGGSGDFGGTVFRLKP